MENMLVLSSEKLQVWDLCSAVGRVMCSPRDPCHNPATAPGTGCERAAAREVPLK